MPSREPIHAAEPASPSTSGGIDSSAKNPASAARPVTRYRRQTATVRVTRPRTTRTGRRRPSAPRPRRKARTDLDDAPATVTASR